MKIGILTFHSQLNYGGVLQCWALQTALEKLGHEVVVIDRRLERGKRMFAGIASRLSFLGWAKVGIRGLAGCGDFSWMRRCLSTAQFLKEELNLTNYSFCDWGDAPDDLGVDMLVVGSDQVWHCGAWGNPLPYLLVGAPPVPAIAYAASFGMAQLPRHVFENAGQQSKLDSEIIFKKALQRFKRISCREMSGVRICSQLGYEAAHVVDPTLLAFYNDSAIKKRTGQGLPTLVCYFMSVNVYDVIHELENFARKERCRVVAFVDSPLKPMCKTVADFVDNVKHATRRLISSVRVVKGGGPLEFFSEIVNARWVVSDSFHALMFSIIGGANVRILRPDSELRREIFSRIAEFADHANGTLVVDSARQALASFERKEEVAFDGEWINWRVASSREWLREALG